MLSIIISFKYNENAVRINENIQATVGIEHEILLLNNDGTKGLSMTYNQGAAKSKFSFLCFVHDDVLFHTQNWGQKLLNHLQHHDTGVVGVAGGRYKSGFGMGWRDGTTDFYRYSVKDGKEAGKHLCFNPQNQIKAEVICLDGMFLSCRKEVWQQFPFDEQTYKGFHFYDMDFCMLVKSRYKNFVVYDILLEHFSQGNRNKQFIISSFLFEKKWNDQLPAFIEPLPQETIRKLEGYIVGNKLALMKQLKISWEDRWQLLKKYLRLYKSPYLFFRSVYFGFIK